MNRNNLTQKCPFAIFAAGNSYLYHSGIFWCIPDHVSGINKMYYEINNVYLFLLKQIFGFMCELVVDRKLEVMDMILRVTKTFFKETKK